MGMNIHYMADELWEGINIQLLGQGFVETVEGKIPHHIYNTNQYYPLNYSYKYIFFKGYNFAGDGEHDTNEMPVNYGGDFYASFAYNEKELSVWERYFPIEDIYNIYHRNIAPLPDYYNRSYPNVTIASLLECQGLFDLGLWAEKGTYLIFYLLLINFIYSLYEYSFTLE